MMAPQPSAPGLPPALQALLQRRGAAELLLLLATAIWGLAYLITRGATRDAAPLIVIATRFFVASATVRLLARPDLRGLTRHELAGGAVIGMVMVGGYVSQAVAMHHIAPGRTAFINALYVPLVPLVQFALQRLRPAQRRQEFGPFVWLALALSVGGLWLMAGPANMGGAGGGFGLGEAWALFGAAAIAGEVMLVARFAPRSDPRRLAVVQCLAMACYCTLIALITGTPWPGLHAAWLLPAVGLGCTSAFLQIAANWAMRRLTATRATFIYASEPVWAAGFGAIAGERMGGLELAGAALILLSLVLPKGKA